MVTSVRRRTRLPSADSSIMSLPKRARGRDFNLGRYRRAWLRHTKSPKVNQGLHAEIEGAASVFVQLLTKSQHRAKMRRQSAPDADRRPIQLRQLRRIAISAQLSIKLAQLSFDGGFECYEFEVALACNADPPGGPHGPALEHMDIELTLLLLVAEYQQRNEGAQHKCETQRPTHRAASAYEVVECNALARNAEIIEHLQHCDVHHRRPA